MPSEPGGPYLSMALLCEKVLREQDGVISVIRIVDRIAIEAGSDAPERMPALPVQTTAVVGFKSGLANGQYNCKLTVESPNGTEKDLAIFPMLFEGNDRGSNLIVTLNLQIEEQGLHWIGVYMESELMTRVPLRIIYRRIGLLPSQPNP